MWPVQKLQPAAPDEDARPKAFFLVWSPAGLRPPKYRHTTHGSALGEAHRLAAAHPGREFYVVETTDRVVLDSQAMGAAESDEDDIPF
jgi:hypothetical protein